MYSIGLRSSTNLNIYYNLQEKSEKSHATCFHTILFKASKLVKIRWYFTSRVKILYLQGVYYTSRVEGVYYTSRVEGVYYTSRVEGI